MSAIQTQFGRRVRKLRTDRGLSQEGLASTSGLHRTYIGGIERGERNVSLRNIDAIAHGLGIAIAEIFAELTLPRSAAAGARSRGRRS